MPEAIATTKRKFYRALDALSTSASAPSTQTAPQPTGSTSSSKRSSAAAFDEARERVRKRLRQSTSNDSLSGFTPNTSVISLAGKPSARNTSSPSKPPNFSPWSQETFLARLKTFGSVSLWHPKPDAINEVEWAKRGWTCVDVNTVACKGGCNRRVVVSVDIARRAEQSRAAAEQQEEGEEEGEEEEEEDLSFEQALTERYKSQIVEGHGQSCLWRQEGCKDDIYRLQVVRPSVWQPELHKRVHSLLNISKSIEQAKTRPLESFNDKVMNDLPRELLGLGGSSEVSKSKAFEIAMHGWRGSSESGNDLLHCDACFQRVGLWMYQPDYKRPGTSSSDHTPNDEGDEAGILDLTEMHRDHCPWRNAITQKATGSLDGLNACQVLQRVVSTAARDHRRRSAPQNVDETDDEPASETASIQPSKEEIARTDKERESRLRKLKNLLSIKRRPTTKVPAQKAN
ncbi:hypothetical protein M409DRAFT_69555 [Zasmidium cellare ATCC 36951]|uniref:C3HC-type domain-containing protein n=1 Tax=Zasmidium cellare ATCC 36951 TaxID=1080233 RepID=A0A6A6C673_ZASCE|nr:uncharacterized protein M409DRAFT_69555 [Zasmidium cellare ATCC 36951]KAF2161748.1 hypothetical protein M409DRAFT_69555 [Zasmidium cellare ATCC 36951]